VATPNVSSHVIRILLARSVAAADVVGRQPPNGLRATQLDAAKGAAVQEALSSRGYG